MTAFALSSSFFQFRAYNCSRHATCIRRSRPCRAFTFSMTQSKGSQQAGGNQSSSYTSAENAEAETSSAENKGSEIGYVKNTDVKDTKARVRSFYPERYAQASKALWNIGWGTWWVQLALTSVSAVIILFAFAFPGVRISTSSSSVGLILTGTAVLITMVSLFWTYSYTRLALKLSSSSVSPRITLNRAKVFLKIGIMVAISGIFASLLGLQATAGTLLARLLTSRGPEGSFVQLRQDPASGGAESLASGSVQPIDILVIQATANAMSSLLFALIASLWLQGRSRLWSEPSHEEFES